VAATFALGVQARAARAECAKSAHRYGLVAPLYSTVENISAAELEAMLHGKRRVAVGMSATTRAALGAPAGPEYAEPTTAQWAIVPADELSPAWQVITIDGVQPLAPAAAGPLVVDQCGPTNIDAAALTTLTMTGTTAMTRFTAQLMDTRGVTYPARDLAAWLATSDFVHVSNEVSFNSTCETEADRSVRRFCSKDAYIELLAALHVNIVELTGSHLIDKGYRHLRHTIELYEARGWQFFGGGRDQIEATRPLLIEHHGNKLALLGCNEPRSGQQTIRNGPNVAFCDMARLEWQVRDLRSRGYLPVVSIQHEEVPRHTPPGSLVRDFRRLADAGAAVVFGSQAHVAHPFAMHGDAYVHYGAGNFIFDQPWLQTTDGVVDRFYFHRGKLLTVQRLYTRIEDHGKPRVMTDKERAWFIGVLRDALAEIPKARRPRKPTLDPRIPDSFLVGTQPIYLWVTPSPTGVQVALRRPPHGIRKKALDKAIAGFIAAKYGPPRDPVALR
jgi:poly-gamma-glutamate synthesis protein (capsule biosynthesis protein)